MISENILITPLTSPAHSQPADQYKKNKPNFTTLRPQKEVPWILGMVIFQVSEFLPTVVFTSSPFWPVLTNPKHLPLAEITKQHAYCSCKWNGSMTEGGNKGNRATGEKRNSLRQGWDLYLSMGLYSVVSVYSKTVPLEN